MPFFELVYDDFFNSSFEEPIASLDLESLCDLLAIRLNIEELIHLYRGSDELEGEILVFHSDIDLKEFICLDLLTFPHDSHKKIQFSLRIKESSKEMAYNLLERIYFKSDVRSAWTIDYFENSRWNKLRDLKREYKCEIGHITINEHVKKIRLKRHFRLGSEITIYNS